MGRGGPVPEGVTSGTGWCSGWCWCFLGWFAGPCGRDGCEGIDGGVDQRADVDLLGDGGVVAPASGAGELLAADSVFGEVGGGPGADALGGDGGRFADAGVCGEDLDPLADGGGDSRASGPADRARLVRLWATESWRRSGPLVMPAGAARRARCGCGGRAGCPGGRGGG